MSKEVQALVIHNQLSMAHYVVGEKTNDNRTVENIILAKAEDANDTPVVQVSYKEGGYTVWNLSLLAGHEVYYEKPKLEFEKNENN